MNCSLQPHASEVTSLCMRGYPLRPGYKPSQHCYSEALVACREAGQWNAAAQLHARLLLDIPTGAARQVGSF